MSTMNRLANTHNQYQGNFRKVLCVCSAGLLRSPSTAFVLSQEPFNFNTRAAGINEEYALIQVDQVLLEWADQIVCMDTNQQLKIINMLAEFKMKKAFPVVNLGIPDAFEYRDPELLKIIKEQALEYFQEIK